MQSIRKLFDKFMIMVCEYDFQENEVMKEIPNYNSNGRYYITNIGKIISLCGKKWLVRKPEFSKKDGHLYIKLHYKGLRINKGVHQLVAENFIPHPEDLDGLEVHHIDFDPLNNNVENLVFLTKEEHQKIHAKHEKELREKHREQ